MNRKQIAFNEGYRLKRMAHLAKGLHTILDIGYVDCPNIYLNNSEVIGLDIKEGHKPKNYNSIVTCNIKEFIKCNHKKTIAFSNMILGSKDWYTEKLEFTTPYNCNNADLILIRAEIKINK